MAVSNKLDLKKELKWLYHPSAKDVAQVDVPTFNYLMIDGEGDPSTSLTYAETVEALFSVSYAAKFKIKKGALGIDYAVMPLEGLWWADDMSSFARGDREQWKWTMMIMQPSFVDADVIETVIAEVGYTKKIPAIAKLRFEAFREGHCAQIMHIGPFSEEGPTILRLHDFIEDRARISGKHHEIYLSDIRRANPKNWKTIIRQPMR